WKYQGCSGRLLWALTGGFPRSRPRSGGCREGSLETQPLPLVNRQCAVIQLHHGQVRGRGEYLAALAALPTAVGALHAHQSIERLLAVLLPGDFVGVLGAGEEAVPAVVAQDVDRLGVIVVRVLVETEAAAAESLQMRLAELEPLLNQRRVVVAKAEA